MSNPNAFQRSRPALLNFPPPPFAARLFDQGVIPSRRGGGTHRRALASDVMSYREKEKAARLETLDELAAAARRLGL